MGSPRYMTIGEWEALDPGIRATVDALRGAGFETCDSGDGYSKPSDERDLEWAHVFMQVAPEKAFSEARRLREWLAYYHGIHVEPLGTDISRPHIQVTWDPTNDVAIIELGGVMLGDPAGGGGVSKPRYRLCWWCNRKLQGPFGRVVTFEGPQDVIVHAECAPKVVKEHDDVVVSVTCVPGCPCRKHATTGDAGKGEP